MLAKLFKFHGGVKPDSRKTASTQRPIAPLPLAPQLVVPLHQSIGGTPRPMVAAGERVLKGQPIGAAEGPVSAAVHAPTSGIVRAIEERTMPHPSGLAAACVVIESDGEDRWIEREPIPWQSMPGDELRDFLRDAGVVGLGGATFPSHIKLRPGDKPTHTLVLNGAECEPFITCDDMLMRERAGEIVRGALIMARMLRVERVLIGIEDNKPEAIAAMREAAREGVEVVAIPTLYPAGGEKQLLRVLTGVEVAAGRRPVEFGLQCFNVGTAYRVARAIDHAEPLISRIVTVAGNVEAPGNFEVAIGTPIDALLAAGKPLPGTDRILMGGPMMGFALPTTTAPVVKGTNCILVGDPTLLPPPPPEMACIRCGTCAQHCPADLQPFELYWYGRAHNFGKAQEYHLFDCIECGCCSYVCPSNIPLVDYFRYTKGEIWAREREKSAADSARERFEARNERQEREKREKAEKLAAKAAATRQKLADKEDAGDAPAAPATSPAEEAKKALIAAALERAKQQKSQVRPRNTDNLSADKLAEIDEIEARRTQPPGATIEPPESK
ncbi:MAG: electron transport complex subunit RsxC [Rhodocyclaceae bacterium]|nr:electron transport complex subunit RsxC [Rhodocyclaceae bacterium]